MVFESDHGSSPSQSQNLIYEGTGYECAGTCQMEEENTKSGNDPRKQNADPARCAQTAINHVTSHAYPEIRWHAEDRRYMFTILDASGKKVAFQTTVQAANNSQADAERICRLCFDHFKQGASKPEVLSLRASLYAELNQTSQGGKLCTQPREQHCLMEGNVISTDLCSSVQLSSKTEQMRPKRCTMKGDSNQNSTVAKIKKTNNHFCEICQQRGRMLLCDSCPRAYHAVCIESLVSQEDLVQTPGWTCPVCRNGLDSIQGRNMPTPGTLQLKNKWLSSMRADKRQHRMALHRRDFFLSQHLGLIMPFVIPSAFFRIEQISKAQQAPVLQIGAQVQALGRDDLMFEAMVLAQTGQSRYLIMDVGVGAEAELQRENLAPLDIYDEPQEATDASVTVPDFLSSVSRPILKEGCNLTEYQTAGVNWLLHSYHNRAGCILADDMGLGKTIQALACLSYLHATGVTRGPALIVVPLSCAGNWLREARHFVPHLSVAKLWGSAREREHSLNDDAVWYGAKDLIVTTYETVVSLQEFFADNFWSALVLDEAHRIKNVSSKVREALNSIRCAGRILLTGTPLQNNLGELFALLRFLWPDILARESDVFMNAVHLPENALTNDDPGKAASYDGEAIVDATLVQKIRSLLSVLMLRRRKDDVAHLPPKLVHDIWLPLSPCQAKWYRMLLQTRPQLTYKGLQALLKLMVRLRLLSCHPQCLLAKKGDYDELVGYDAVDLEELRQLQQDASKKEFEVAHSNKLTFVDKLLRHLHAQNMGLCPMWRHAFEKRQHGGKQPPTTAEWLQRAEGTFLLDGMRNWQRSIANHCPVSTQQGSEPTEANFEGDQTTVPQPHKVIIFSQFHACLDVLQDLCVRRCWRFLRLDGTTHRVLRELDIRDFNSADEDCFVYLISTRAGGLGINLVSANHVVLFDPDWNPHVDNQAIDRTHRLGQTRAVKIYRLVQEWTLEERLACRQEQKLKMQRCVIPHDNDFANTDADDIGNRNKDSLSAAEILALIRHGEKALLEFPGQSLDDTSLQAMMTRQHRPFPTSYESEQDIDKHEACLGPITPVLDEVKNRSSHDTASQRYSSITGATRNRQGGHDVCDLDVRMHAHDNNQEVRRTASGRIVRPPVNFVLPAESPKKHVKKVLRHCNVCFLCCKGKPTKVEQSTVNTVGADLPACGVAPDVVCTMCPQAYHAECLGNKAPASSKAGRWLCMWHFCAGCSRNSTECGGILLHCYTCPSALCYDCFPSEFRRVHPPQHLWDAMNSRGWAINARNTAFFQCNSCRTKEEDRRRNVMLEEEFRAEHEEQHRAALEEKQKLVASKQRQEKEEAARRMHQLMLEHERQLLQQKLDKMQAELVAAVESLPTALEKKANDLTKDSQFKRARVALSTLLCRNCKLPCHGTSQCPFPVEKVTVSRERQGQKRLYKVLCGLCRCEGHKRVQCSQLTAEHCHEYEVRLKSMKILLNSLQEVKPITMDCHGIDVDSNDSTNPNNTEKELHKALTTSLTRAGLPQCIADTFTSQQLPAISGRKRRQARIWAPGSRNKRLGRSSVNRRGAAKRRPSREKARNLKRTGSVRSSSTKQQSLQRLRPKRHSEVERAPKKKRIATDNNDGFCKPLQGESASISCVQVF